MPEKKTEIFSGVKEYRGERCLPLGNSAYGFLATFLNCSVIVGFTKQACSEGSKAKSSYFAPRLIRYYFHLLHDNSAASSSSHINNTTV